MPSLHDFVLLWQRFFHYPEPPHTVALVRIGLACLLLINNLQLWKDAVYWFGPNGVHSEAFYRQHHWSKRLDLFRYLPKTDAMVHMVMAANLLFIVLLLVGFLTPLSAVMVFLTLTTLHHRNSAIVHGGDTTLRLLSFLLMFSQAGGALSVDSLWLGSSGDASPWALRLMQIQLCAIYYRSAFWKLRGKTWLDGTACYYPLQIHEFSRNRFPALTSRLWAIRVMTWSTLVIEVLFPLLVWFQETRYVCLISAVALHLGIEATMRLHLFSWSMLVFLIVFVPPSDARAFVEWLL